MYNMDFPVMRKNIYYKCNQKWAKKKESYQFDFNA